MKRFEFSGLGLGLMFIASLMLCGCTSTGNHSASPYSPAAYSPALRTQSGPNMGGAYQANYPFYPASGPQAMASAGLPAQAGPQAVAPAPFQQPPQLAIPQAFVQQPNSAQQPFWNVNYQRGTNPFGFFGQKPGGC
jgi:hypothetical protein